MGERAEIARMTAKFREMIEVFRDEIGKVQEYLNRHDAEIAELRAKIEALEKS